MKKENNLTKKLEKLSEIAGWFENQEDIDIEKGLEKIKEGVGIIKESKKRLQEIENEFKEIKKEIK